jgi:hypothetical protein
MKPQSVPGRLVSCGIHTPISITLAAQLCLPGRSILPQALPCTRQIAPCGRQEAAPQPLDSHWILVRFRAWIYRKAGFFLSARTPLMYAMHRGIALVRVSSTALGQGFCSAGTSSSTILLVAPIWLAAIGRRSKKAFAHRSTLSPMGRGFYRDMGRRRVWARRNARTRSYDLELGESGKEISTDRLKARSELMLAPNRFHLASSTARVSRITVTRI